VGTPRKRYFAVADSIIREPWDRGLKLTLVLLMAHLNTRWARDGIPNRCAGRAPLLPGDVQNITGEENLESGFEILSRLSRKVSLKVTMGDGYIHIDWPKFPSFQRYGVRKKGPEQGPPRAPKRAPKVPPSASASASASQVREEPPKPPEGASEKPDPKWPKKQDILLAWDLAVEAAASYDKPWTHKLESHQSDLRKRLKEHPERGADAFAECVHGYVHRCRPTSPKQNGFQWRRFLTPRSLLRVGNFADNVAAFDEAQRKAIIADVTEGSDQTISKKQIDQVKARLGLGRD
jgi:hypothetical protein